MDAIRFDSRRAARMMLGTLVLMVAVQVLLAAFRPTDAHALRRWGGGYEVLKSPYGYVLFCEEPKNEVFDPVYASRVWRRTFHSAYVLDWREAMRIRDNMNLWFATVTEHEHKSRWLGKRCLTMAGHRAEEFRAPWYYNGLDGSEFKTDVDWARSSLYGTIAQGTSQTP